jgi:ADP-ribose pyrophosphatase
MTEIVGGMIDPGEQPDDVARRETREETGCAVISLERIVTFMPSPGALAETVHLYLGIVDSGTATPHAGLADEHEDIRVAVVPWAAAFAAITDGSVQTGPALTALYWLALNRARLRAAAGVGT